MRGLKGATAGCLTLAVLVLAAPAQAQSLTISDPSGDAAGSGLDITGAMLKNGDHAFIAVMTFVADVHGNLIVAVGTRSGHIFRIVSEHPSQGADTTYLLSRSGQTVPCEGLTSSWDRPSATVELRLPSVCMSRGNFGAVHSWVLTEDPGSGRDVDYAPVDGDGELRFTGWIPRG